MHHAQQQGRAFANSMSSGMPTVLLCIYCMRACRYVGGLGAATDGIFQALRAHLQQAAGAGQAGGSGQRRWDVSLARSVDELRQAKAVPAGKRLNPKQRQRLKQKMAQQ